MSGLIPQRLIDTVKTFNDLTVGLVGIDCTLYIPTNLTSIESKDMYATVEDVTYIEYQNQQLNTLIKSYLENREIANEQWHSRKNEMVQEAIKEGKSTEKPKEHPISIMQQIYLQNEDIQKAQEKVNNLKEKLNSNYTEVEREEANVEFNKILKNTLQTIKEGDEEGSEEVHEVNDILERIKNLELERENLQNKEEIDNKEIESLNIQIKLLKDRLSDPDVINEYINTNYKNPQIKLV
jgi:hypothetical protein